MTPWTYKLYLKTLLLYFDYHGYKLIKETNKAYVFNIDCSEVVVPKLLETHLLLFIIFVLDGKVIDYFETNFGDYKKAYAYTTNAIRKHIETQRLKDL
jgi:hypothetical protein